MHFYLMLLAVVLTCVAADVVHDNDCQDSSPLCDRLGQLERLLSQQHHLLRQLQSTVSRQEGQLQRHEKELSHEKQLNRQQAKQLSYQQNLLQRQEEQLSKQEILLNQQSAILTQQDRLLLQQELKLSRQASLVQQLRTEKAGDSAELKTVKERLDSVPVNTDCDNERTEFPSLSDSNDSAISITRNVERRSDDQGPLEAVVSHMGQQLTEMSADIQALKNSDNQQDQAIQDAQSSTFIHWGSSQCSNASQLVYSGVVGGSPHDQTGAATNYLCLTMSPVLSDRSLPNAWTFLYGGEYETRDSHQNMDAVCAMCRSHQSTTIMIPGTNVCTPGWHQHYSGFLMAGHYSHPAGSEFICVDSRFESRPGSNSMQYGRLLYFTTTVCGSLPCEPYVNNKLVTCVVCSK